MRINTRISPPSLIALAGLAITLSGCASRRVQSPAIAPQVSSDNSYIDLQAGYTLRVVTPLLKPGARTSQPLSVTASQGGLTVSAANSFLGYETSYYRVTARPHSGVSIHFASAERTVNGKTTPEEHPNERLFQLPRSARYVRLLYLRRVSKADHNMAVLASSRMDRLDALTKRVQTDPANCRSESHVFCEWIPAGVAVRPEAPKQLSEAPQLSPPGKLIDVNGYPVHLYCVGTGSPTVVIAGAGFSFDWALIQPKVSKFVRVCTYDPSGTAWSSNSPPQHGCLHKVEELHALLHQAKIKGPYVLVGFSIGALSARLYAVRYSGDVSGMVLIDHAFLNTGTPSSPAANTRAFPYLDAPPVLLSQTRIGFHLEDDPNFNKLPQRDRDLHYWASSLKNALPTQQDAEQCLSELASATANAAAPLGSKPLIVISTPNPSANYQALQTKLLSLSRNSRQLIAEDSSHAIILDRPDVVIHGIGQVVNAVRHGTTL